MEMSWEGNVDHQPTEGDAYFFPYVSGGFMGPSDAVIDLWNKDCAYVLFFVHFCMSVLVYFG